MNEWQNPEIMIGQEEFETPVTEPDGYWFESKLRAGVSLENGLTYTKNSIMKMVGYLANAIIRNDGFVHIATSIPKSEIDISRVCGRITEFSYAEGLVKVKVVPCGPCERELVNYANADVLEIVTSGVGSLDEFKVVQDDFEVNYLFLIQKWTTFKA